MKAKYVISALALPLIFGACSNEDLITENANTALNGNMIELPQNFTLVGKKTAPAETRSEMMTWGKQNVLAWVPNVTVKANLTADKQNWDQIGLAWLNETPGNKVYTNYRFQHYGWLDIDETSAEIDECTDDKKIKNGVYFTGDAGEFKSWDGTSEQDVTAFDNSADLEFTADNFTTAGVNPANGLFKTDNSTIFTGDYLVYYPFNEDLKEVGYLTATSNKVFTNADTKAEDKDAKYTGDYMKNLAPELFMVGRTSIEGGMQASDFNMGTLSGMVAVKVSNKTTSNLTDIHSIVLYAQGNTFLTSAQLDASKIVNSESVKQGTALYVVGGKQETSETLISTASADVTLATDQYTVFGFAALPTTATDVIAVVQDANGNSFAQEIGDVTVKPNAWTAIEVNVDEALSNKVLYAYDATSLATAITAAGAAASEETRATIKVLGEIELTANDNQYGAQTLIPDYTTVEGGKLVVVPGSKLQTTNTTSVVKSAIDIQGQDCCTERVAGRLVSFGGVFAGEINVLAGYTGKNAGSIEFRDGTTANVEGTINNYGKVTTGTNSATSQTLVNLSGTINNYGELTIYKGATGNSTEDAKVAVLANGNFNNKAEGSVTVEGVLAIYPGNATNQGTIYDKVSSQITGNIANLGTEGEYVCDVDNNGIRFEAALNERPTTIIRFVKTGSYEMDKVGGKSETIKKFVVATEAGNVTFISKAEAKAINSQSIKKLEIEEGASLSVTTNKTSGGALHLTVEGTVNVAGTLTISEAASRDEVVFNAGTMNVEKTLTIGKAVSCELGSLNIAKSAAATFSVNSITDVEGAIVNNGTATITLASGGTEDISARVWYHNVAPSGDGVWANGTPTQAL